MKAIVMNAYGGPEVVELKDVPKPRVADGDVLIQVKAVGLNAGDYFSMRGSPWLARLSVGFPKPKDHILGWDVAGEVVGLGRAVKRFKLGDKVFCSTMSALAEYATAPEDKVALAPAGLDLEEAAAVPTAAATALIALRDRAKVKPGQKVLINGASGGVGSFSVQIAKVLGGEVTGVCSTRNADMVRSLGADHVIDYTKHDFTKTGLVYDVILDNVGNHSFAACRKALAPGGIHVPNTGHGGMSYVIKAYSLSAVMKQQASPFMAVPTAPDLEFLGGLIDTGKLRPVIDRTYPIEQTAEALHYLENEHARGKVVVLLESSRG